MTQDSILLPPADSELMRLVEAMCEGTITAHQTVRLESLLCVSRDAKLFYLAYLDMHAQIQWMMRGEPDKSFDGDRAGTAPASSDPSPVVTDGQSGDWRSDDSFNRDPAGSVPVASGQWPVVSGQQTTGGLSRFSSDENGTVPLPSTNPQSPIPNPSPYLGFLGSAYHGVSGYIGDHDWAKGMLGGTVFLALLFAVLGSIEIFSRWRQANRPQPQDNQVVDVPAVRAAKLTGVYDCRWTGNFRPPRNEVLNVDDYINLASGLAEVTYDSGAKVLLQGPCTYKIESPSSGYLKVGRLTARVKGNEELGTKKEELPAPTSSLLLPTSSFVVNTPTATVTDLGTEFGVDVDKQGATDSLVFVGSVKLETPVADGEKAGREVTLIENQSAHVEQQDGKQYVVRRDVVKPEGFVRPDQIQEWLAMAREAAAKRNEAARPSKEDGQAAHSIVERFSNGKLSKCFEQMPPGCYELKSGDAVYRPVDGKVQSRGYLRTVSTDYCERDFVFEATISVLADESKDFSHRIYFGIGDGVPNTEYYDQPTCGLALVFLIDERRAFVERCYPEVRRGMDMETLLGHAMMDVVPRGGLGWGLHRLRLTKRGGQVQFAVDKDYNGAFKADFESPWLDLATIVPQLNLGNSRLMIGTGYLDTVLVVFKELSIDFPKETQDRKGVVQQVDSEERATKGSDTD